VCLCDYLIFLSFSLRVLGALARTSEVYLFLSLLQQLPKPNPNVKSQEIRNFISPKRFFHILASGCIFWLSFALLPGLCLTVSNCQSRSNLLLKHKRVSLHHPTPTPQPKKKETKNTFLWVHSAKWMIFQVSNFNFQSIQSLGENKNNQLAWRNLFIQCCININNESNNIFVILYVVHGLSRSASLVGLPLGFRLPLDGPWLWGCVISFFGLSRNKAILTSLVELCLWGRDAYVPCLQLTHHAQTYP